MIQVRDHGDVVFVKRDAIAVTERGLESAEHRSPRFAGLRVETIAGREEQVFPGRATVLLSLNSHRRLFGKEIGFSF